MKPTHLFALLAFLAISCNDKKDVNTKPKAVAASSTKFQEVKDLSQFKETNFILTPQSPLPEGRNAIYSPTMLYAWNEIKDLAAGDVHVDSKYTDLALLNYSKSFLNSLHPEEFKTDITMENGLITMTAEFSKSLPFEKMFHNFSGLFQFKGQKVQSFGCNGDDYELMKLVEILHYKNDSDFIVKLIFKDIQHEMLLCMTKEKPTTLEALFKHIEAKTKAGKGDKVMNPSDYSMNSYDDELIVPKLSFNIENDYKKLIDNEFLAENEHFRIKKAWQRTAFVLDESGAAAESEALIAADSLGVEEEKPRPKKLHFNKPFLVMIKRKDSPNPYFAMWVENTELMQKE
jgi:hypothetical protein